MCQSKQVVYWTCGSMLLLHMSLKKGSPSDPAHLTYARVSYIKESLLSHLLLHGITKINQHGFLKRKSTNHSTI